jgi:hypothetical protein
VPSLGAAELDSLGVTRFMTETRCCDCGVRPAMKEEECANVRVGMIRPGPEGPTMCRQCWTGMVTSLVASTDVTQLKLDLLPKPPPMTHAQRERYEKICMRCNWLSWRLNNPALKEPNPTTRLRGGIRLCDACAEEIGSEE